MKRTITLIVAMTFALSMGGCSWFKKKSDPAPAKAEQMDKKPMKKHSKKMTHKKKTSKGVKKGKRILCSTKKTYAKGTPCWHWKRGARIGKASAKK